MDDYQKKQKALKDKNAAQKSSNPTILAGIVVCAHCGAKMSAFLHKDRYKLADGSIRERVQAKYNCYQRGQHLRGCDGQALYLAERVDRLVAAYPDELFCGKALNRESGSRMLNITDKNRLLRRKSRQPSISSNAMRMKC